MAVNIPTDLYRRGARSGSFAEGSCNSWYRSPEQQQDRDDHYKTHDSTERSVRLSVLIEPAISTTHLATDNYCYRCSTELPCCQHAV